MKEIPLPEMIGDMILVDEIHRTFGSKNFKFTVASDCLSRFSKLYLIIGSMNKEKFVKQILRISGDF